MVSEPAAPAPAAAARVPLVVYSASQNRQLADEVERATAADIWPDYMADYGRTRRAICAAEGWRQAACRQIRRAGGGS
jgi:hypothetical protein